jgi:hypothetical protein
MVLRSLMLFAELSDFMRNYAGFQERVMQIIG